MADASTNNENVKNTLDEGTLRSILGEEGYNLDIFNARVRSFLLQFNEEVVRALILEGYLDSLGSELSTSEPTKEA